LYNFGDKLRTKVEPFYLRFTKHFRLEKKTIQYSIDFSNMRFIGPRY